MISSILKAEVAVEYCRYIHILVGRASEFAYLEVEVAVILTIFLYYWQGLNPMMFMFALVGNLTYVGR